MRGSEEGRSSRLGKPALVAGATLGFASMLAQLVSLREFVASIGGNELVIGTFLASSLLLTAAGAWIGGLVPRGRGGVLALLVLSIPLAPTQVAAIRLIRAWVFAGTTPSLGAIFCCALLVLLPASLVFGALFSQAAAWSPESSLPGRVYLAETFGAVAGGVLYTLAGLVYLPVFALVCLPAAASAAAAAAISWQRGARGAVVAILSLAAFLVVATYTFGTRHLLLRHAFPGQEIVREIASPYANLVLTRAGSQLNLFANGSPVASSEAARAAEETVHFAMAQRPDARRVLVFEGAASGAVAEILKYPVRAIDDVEIDSAMLELAEAVSGAVQDPRLRVIVDDPRRFSRRHHEPYDVIISAAPDPATTTLNRLFTLEFFTELEEILRPGGVVAFTIEGSENYRGPESRKLNRALAQTLASVFPHTLVLPAGRLVFLGSAEPLHADVFTSLEERGIGTRYVNRAYMGTQVTPQRVARLAAELRQPGPVNRDLEPSLYRLYLARWLAELGGSALWLGVAFLLVGAVAVRNAVVGRGAPVRGAILSSGFASLAMEFCLLLGFQMIRGSLFLQMGILVAAFMLGTAAGAAAALGRAGSGQEIRWLRSLEAASAISAAGTAALFALGFDSILHYVEGTLAFSLLLATFGFLTGAEFPLAVAGLDRAAKGSASKLYAADLIGASVGAATAGVLLVPLLGIVNVCLLVAAVKAASFLWLLAPSPTGAWRARALEPQPISIGLTSFLLLLAAAALVIAPGTEMAVYGLSFSKGYHVLILSVLFLGLSLTLELRPASWDGRARLAWLSVFRRAVVSRPAQHLAVAIFSLPTYYPLLHCYFQVPYLFCHVCPRVCVFGYLRPFWVPAAFLMNLGSYSWCLRLCPIGALLESRAGKQALARWPRRLSHGIRLGVLAFVCYAYFAMPAGAANESPLSTDLYSVLFKNAYSVSSIVLAVTAGLLVLNRWVPKSFCNLLCPVGASCDLAHALLNRIPASKPRPAGTQLRRDGRF